MELVIDGGTLSGWLVLFLWLISVVAGFLDTLAGGGGLLTLPALIMCGVPPLFALGTNKLQGTMGTATATIVMLKSGQVLWSEVRFLMMSAFLGATAGTIVVQFIDTTILDFVIPAVLFLTAIYFLMLPVESLQGQKPKITAGRYRQTVVPSIGWYDGMFGPGTGSFFALAGVSLRGEQLIHATAVAKTLNFSTNIASLIVFLVAGKIIWMVGVSMMAGQFLGAWVGSKFLLASNPKYLRILIVMMCLLMLMKYMTVLF